MGWWSYDVLGGDPALDALGDTAEACGVGYNSMSDEYEEKETYYGYNFNKVKEQLKTVKDIENLIKKCSYAFKDEYREEIDYQVLGLVLMSVGNKIPKKNKDKIIKSIKKDEWAKECTERKETMDNYLKVMESYIGKDIPVILNQKGLFESLNEHLQSGKKGLLNK